MSKTGMTPFAAVPPLGSQPILSVAIRSEPDVVTARQRARQLAALLGFESRDQTRIATAVSEVARNAFQYAGGGSVEFSLEGRTAPQVLLIRIHDQGPGIADLSRIFDGQYHSPTGMGVGLSGTRRLMDQFHIESVPRQGTTVWLRKLLPRKAPLVTASDLGRVADELARQRPRTLLEEVQQQNQELLRALEELRTRQDELLQLNRELEDTNRGVVALYAEIDEKADHLRRANELKSRFLSNMSHEFRTPVNAILSLSRLLLDRTDGELTTEQEKQVLYIRKAAETLSELTNDLLDLMKVEAGKTTVRPTEFEVKDLFSALRGMLRPLLPAESVQLIFDEPRDLPSLYTDESKVSQILRNFLSNALKFTERGEVRVSASLTPDETAVVFSVADTGIGIAPADQDVIFQEFTQLENPLQKRVKGTGLGLPLCKRLVELLGGRISLTSEPGVGSAFSATIPVRYQEPVASAETVGEGAGHPDPARLPVLVVEDELGTLLVYEKLLKGSDFQMFPARSLREARHLLQRIRPRAILLDILLPGEDAWSFLAELKRERATRDIPVLVVTTVEDYQKGIALGADAYCVKPVERHWLLEQLTRLTRQEPPAKILLIDDEEIARYVLTQLLAGMPYVVSEAGSGQDGLRRAREESPRVIFLDLHLGDMTGFTVLDALHADAATRAIPVIVITSKVLEEDERHHLLQKAVEILSKEDLSREGVTAALEKALNTASQKGARRP